jgi:hypothetical protein
MSWPRPHEQPAVMAAAQTARTKALDSRRVSRSTFNRQAVLDTPRVGRETPLGPRHCVYNRIDLYINPAAVAARFPGWG